MQTSRSSPDSVQETFEVSRAFPRTQTLREQPRRGTGAVRHVPARDGSVVVRARVCVHASPAWSQHFNRVGLDPPRVSRVGAQVVLSYGRGQRPAVSGPRNPQTKFGSQPPQAAPRGLGLGRLHIPDPARTSVRKGSNLRGSGVVRPPGAGEGTFLKSATRFEAPCLTSPSKRIERPCWET